MRRWTVSDVAVLPRVARTQHSLRRCASIARHLDERDIRVFLGALEQDAPTVW